MANAETTSSGQCLCGAVSFEIEGKLAEPHACHCTQCRRQSGHFSVSTHIKRTKVHFSEDRGLKWYRSSEIAKRGFCAECGTNLFWDGDDGDLNICAGSLDQPSGLKLSRHIFVDEIADYYEIADGLPRYESFDKKISDT